MTRLSKSEKKEDLKEVNPYVDKFLLEKRGYLNSIIENHIEKHLEAHGTVKDFLNSQHQRYMMEHIRQQVDDWVGFYRVQGSISVDEKKSITEDINEAITECLPAWISSSGDKFK
jgi:hypothetical protein